MSGVQETLCELCLKTVTVNGFEVIDNVTRDILDVLLLKLKFDSEGKEVICNVCRRKLNAAFEFKATCLKTDYAIIPYVDCEKMLQLDIKDVYTKEKTNESMDISDGQKICRLCMEPVESEYRCICGEELEAIEKLAPEMNINIIKDPVVCKECFDSVCTHNSFLKNCWEVQEKITGIFNNAATESQIDTSPSDLFVKTENEDKEFNINEMEMSIKAESIDIKSEDEEGSDSTLQTSDSESFEKSVLRDAEEDECKHENISINECNTKVKQDDKVFYKCDKRIYKTGSKSHFISHRAEAYKCEWCVEGFEVINDVTRDILDVLLLKLKFDSESKEVICNVCRRKLNAAFEFKSTCLKTDYTIFPYVECEKMLLLDIGDAYTKEKTSESMDILDGQRICRLCMEPVESEFRCIREEELEAINKLVPEMNINIIKDPVVCKECFDSVCTHNSFLKNCSEVQEKIGGIFNSAATESRIDTSPADLFVKTENQDKEFDINEMEMSIKAESIDIKSEDEERSGSLLQSSNRGSLEKSDLRDAEDDGYKHENKSTSECNTKVEQDHKKLDSEGKDVICNVCRSKLNTAFEFKSTCLKNDYAIIPYVDCEKMLQLNIRDVYTKEKTSKSMDISDSRRICRLCMEPVESEFRSIREEELEAIEKLAPEMNINIIKDPVVCKECFDSVCTHNSFLKNCLEVQEKIGGIFNSAATESRIDTSPADLFVKIENQDIEFDINKMEMSIKTESIDIKSEDEES
ncbi:uncharacterized protein LOC108904321, partial [Anoplophora glabripennis]|uniref:uncharacterized protein LOC108904321 n=1 Tax=Anoplophora glabripennis TaxID=217634 RepID=UPI000C7713C0